MPELKGRTKYERELSNSIERVLARQRQHLKETGRINSREFKRDFNEAVAIIFAIIFLESGDSLFRQFKLDPGSAGAAGRKWARSYSRDLGDQLFVTSVNKLADARTAGEDPDLERIFGRERAEAIAITEVTRANTEGERRAKAAIEEALELEIPAFWQVLDGEACKVCLGLNGQNLETLPRQYRNGPPAHPSCRCFVRYGVP